MQCLASVNHQGWGDRVAERCESTAPSGTAFCGRLELDWFFGVKPKPRNFRRSGASFGKNQIGQPCSALALHPTVRLTPLRGRQTNRRVPRNQRCPSGQTRARGNGNSWLYDKLLPRESGVAASSLTFRGQTKQGDSISRRGRAQGSIEQRLVATLASCNGLFGGSRP